MTDSTDIPLELQPLRAPARRRSGRRRSELERLVDRTVLGPTHPELGTCWLFTGTTTPYGRIAKAQDSYTHRLGWKLLRGDIPGDKELHHRCGVYACWNPDHLELVTHAENQLRLRKTHCKHGHPLSGDNLRIGPNGVRTCRACNAANQRAFRERHARRNHPSA
jgi:HNH endonuclease